MTDEHESPEDVVRREIERWRTDDISDLPEEDRMGRASGRILMGVDYGAGDDLRIVASFWDGQHLRPMNSRNIDPDEMLKAHADAEEEWLKARQAEEGEANQRYLEELKAIADDWQDDIRRRALYGNDPSRWRIPVSDETFMPRITWHDLWLSLRGQ